MSILIRTAGYTLIVHPFATWQFSKSIIRRAARLPKSREGRRAARGFESRAILIWQCSTRGRGVEPGGGRRTRIHSPETGKRTNEAGEDARAIPASEVRSCRVPSSR
jgi:hypothetical protein